MPALRFAVAAPAVVDLHRSVGDRCDPRCADRRAHARRRSRHCLHGCASGRSRHDAGGHAGGFAHSGSSVYETNAFGTTGEGSGSTISRGSASASTESGPFSFVQILTVVLMVSFIGSVLILAAFGKEPDIGLLCFLFGAILSLADPQTGRAALPKIDWSTVLLVAGIITFVGVLQTMGAVDLLGEGAEAIGSPLIEALGVCSAVIDVSPFSTLGATVVATAPGDHKARLTSILVKFGMSIVIIGPLVLVGGLVVPAMIF